MIRGRAPSRRRRSARPRKSIDWECTAESPGSHNPGAPGAILTGLISPQGVETHGSRLTVLRTIIDIHIYDVLAAGGGNTGGICSVGVIVQDDDGNGNVIALDLLDTDVVEMSWLYYRQCVVGGFTDPVNPEYFLREMGLGPDGHLDIPVKRKMNDNQWLNLYVQVDNLTGVAAIDHFNAALYSRILVQNAS